MRLQIVYLVLAASMSPSTFAQTTRTVLDGVYTGNQAAQGEEMYTDHCVKCHEGNDPEGPTLFGRTFIDRWREDNLDVLFSFIKTRMPRDRSGELSENTYLQILAFLLQNNDYRAGPKELTAGTLEHIRLVGKDGPKPLPPNTLVKAVGCLTQNSLGEWLVTRSSEPVRSREGRETTPEELAKSLDRPLGNHTFKLQNFTNIRFDFRPDPLKGRKVQFKGVLIRGERINLTSLESVARNCD